MRHKSKVNFLIHTFLFVISCSHTTCSQFVNTAHNKAKPFVISDITLYKTSLKHDPKKRLVLLKEYVRELVTDFKYATYDNFTHRILYTDADAYVRLPVAIALKKVQEDLLKNGIGLKVFDAYRP